jgi:hypothetical protein
MEHNTVAVLHGLQEARLAVNYLFYDLVLQLDFRVNPVRR